MPPASHQQQQMLSTDSLDTAINRNVCLCVTIVRHAQTDMNSKPTRVLQGQTDVPINEIGKKEAAALAWRLKKEHFDHIYSSDLKRATETMDEIAKHHPDVRITTDPSLREMDLGDLTGLTWAEAKRLLKQEDQSFQAHIKEKGEGFAKFEQRVVGFYSKLVNEYIVRPHRELVRAATENPCGAFLESSEVESPPTRSPLVIRTDVPRIQPRDANSSLTSPLPHPNLDKNILNLEEATSSTSSTSSTSTQTRSRLLKMKRKNILVITHGGFIHQLLKHLLDELGFLVENDQPQRGFAKNTAVYRFTISKVFQPSGDYDWIGSFITMNSLSHMAANSHGPSPHASPANSPKLKKTPKKGNSPLAKNGGVVEEAPVAAAEPVKPRRSLGW